MRFWNLILTLEVAFELIHQRSQQAAHVAERAGI
jgi:hypothetical protein